MINEFVGRHRSICNSYDWNEFKVSRIKKKLKYQRLQINLYIVSMIETKWEGLLLKINSYTSY